jgi:uncharacterized membrane protein
MKVFIIILAAILFVVASVQMDGDFDAVLNLLKEIFINSASLTVFIILSIIGIIFSIKVARFAYDNFDEVVSRRMRFRSSRVDLYEEGIYYWITNFFNFLIACTLVSLTLIVLCKDILI